MEMLSKGTLLATHDLKIYGIEMGQFSVSSEDVTSCLCLVRNEARAALHALGCDECVGAHGLYFQKFHAKSKKKSKNQQDIAIIAF